MSSKYCSTCGHEKKRHINKKYNCKDYKCKKFNRYPKLDVRGDGL